MFAYNPLVQNRAGEITGQGQINAAQSIASGINSAASGITGGIDRMSQQDLAAKQGDAAIDFGKTLGLFDNKDGEFDEEAYNQMKAMPWQQKAGFASTMTGLINATTMRNYRGSMAGWQQQNADTRTANSQNHFGLIQQ